MAKIGCLKPFRGNKADLSNLVLEDGEIAFATDAHAIYFGDGVNDIKDLTPFIYAGGTDISGIGTGTITNAISTLNSKMTTGTVSYDDFGDVPEGWTKDDCTGIKFGRIVTVIIRLHSSTGLEVEGRLTINNFLPDGYYGGQFIVPCVASSRVNGLLNSTASAIVNVGHSNNIIIDNSSDTIIKDIWLSYTFVR